MSAAPQTSPFRPARPRGPRLRLIAGLKSASRISPRGIWISVLIVLVAFIVQLLLTTVIVEDAYRADALEEQHLELEREHTAAMEKTDAQQSPQHLAEQATDLGMVPAGGSVFLDLESQAILEGDGVREHRTKVDTALVPNEVLHPADEVEEKDQNGASTKKKTEPAVPSDFEMSSPSTR